MSVAVTKQAVEEFLYHEARLLDERRYPEWVEIFAEDAKYWVPAGKEGDPETSVALVYDNKARLRERLVRMASSRFWAQLPPTQTSRIVGNVVVRARDDGDLDVESRLLIALLRRGTHGLLAGSCSHRLVPADGGFLIREKVVRLIERDEPFDNLTFLL